MLTDQERDTLLAAPAGDCVTKERVEGNIAFVQYFHHDTTTIAVFTMKNGYSVVGKAGCVDPVNYNQELGERLAYDDAFGQCYALEGYLLREALFLKSKAV